MGVGSNSAVAGQSHPVLAEKLAVGERWVSIDTDLRPVELHVEEGKRVHIAGREFGSLDVHVVKETSGLVHSGNVSTAHIGETISGLLTSVLPSIKLNHGHDVVNAHVLLGGKLGNLGDVLTLNAKALVKSFREEVLDSCGHDLLENREDDGDTVLRNDGRPVVLWCVDPTVKEVVVTVGETLSLEEEFLSGLLVKLGARRSIEGQPGNVEASILSLLHPVGIEGSLEVGSWPVPDILALNDVQLSIEAESHS